MEIKLPLPPYVEKLLLSVEEDPNFKSSPTSYGGIPFFPAVVVTLRADGADGSRSKYRI